ncbi:MAG: leucyl/phenylalanyl-tRNA--protein transferase [Alphaproteobacteria bacterium]
MSDRRIRLSPELLIRAYASGVFPMAETHDGPVFWVEPKWRGIIPLDGFHLPRRLRRTVRTSRFDVRCDSAFRRVMEECAAPTADRPETWINAEILRVYTEMHRLGLAHSVECWDGELLVGGLYGVSLGGAFFGESMFSRARDASKIALVHLVARLRKGGYRLLDTQFTTEHLTQFGTLEVPQADYKALLAEALAHDAHFPTTLTRAELDAYLQDVIQTS